MWCSSSANVFCAAPQLLLQLGHVRSVRACPCYTTEVEYSIPAELLKKFEPWSIEFHVRLPACAALLQWATRHATYVANRQREVMLTDAPCCNCKAGRQTASPECFLQSTANADEPD